MISFEVLSVILLIYCAKSQAYIFHNNSSQYENINIFEQENDIQTKNIESTLKNMQNEIQNLRNKIQNLEQQSLEPKHDERFNCLENCSPTYSVPKNCKQAMLSNTALDGLYLLKLYNSSLNPFYAYCQRRDGYVWTVIQRREDNTVSFYRNWEDYKNGFGNLDGEHWLGLERLHHLTKDRLHELYIRLINENGEERYAKYTRFSIGNETEKYKLKIAGYNGNAGDSLKGHNGMKYSTYDNNNDNHPSRPCVVDFMGAWWFNYCYNSHLNGLFYSVKSSQNNGIDWDSFAKNLKFSEMMIRPL